MRNFLSKIYRAFSGFLYTCIIFLPDEFSRVRIWYFNKKGCEIFNSCAISSNVRIRGKVNIERDSSIAQNCTLAGEDVGIFVGKNVMIAPNVVIVAFNHGYEMTDIPMRDQNLKQASIVIQDDVWIAANCTIGPGVRIGKGAIISANSFVNKDVLPFTIVGGVPAKFIGSRH